MHQSYNMDKPNETKQVKIDNWGTFFLQRLQHFFNRTDFCDLTLQFVDNVQLKVHRLVLNTCTEYFQMLENSCDVIDDCLIMPMDLQMDVVVPIVNFMYTGQLEFQLQNYDKLYAAAKLMNLTVLTKLLDAQKVPMSSKPGIKRPPSNNGTWNPHSKKIITKPVPEVELPETLPGRKLPVWKRKTAPHNLVRPKLESITPERLLGSTKAMPIQHSQDNTPRPTRFEWPEDDSLSEMTSSFDDISYDSTPLATPVKTSTASLSSSVAFEELQKSSRGVKRASPQEQVIENEEADYLDLHDSSSNEYVPRAEKSRSDNHEDSSVQIISSDEAHNKSTLKPPANEEEPPSKKVRFSVEGKENVKKPRKQIIEAKVKLDGADLSDHTKIISELLKKYPHLVNKNKNIKLKIMQKNSNDPKDKTKTSTPLKVVVKDVKPDNDASTSEKEDNPLPDQNEPEWTCTECSIPNDYIQIKSYPEFHEHLVEFHPEKIDPKVCELCGYKSTRRHLLLYHQLIKHNVAPPPQFNFPRCERCDYIAINGTALRKHSAQHEIEIKCEICSATFNSNVTFLKHCHERGHNFDCAYCEKKFVHSEFVKIHMTNFHKDKINQTNPQSIKILSNVPITGPIEDIYPESSHRLATPSSEAEALVNVASGIAASLGLVVMNDNRQYVLQSNEQDEYIIPEMTEEHLLHDTHEDIIVSEQNSIIQQGSIVTTSNSLTTMTSTDELVMVLTDHDYSDGNNQLISSDNSNIVVLYSHPVEGCSNTTQYISAEGNIVLNSETGVIEMNGQKLAVANTDQLTINDIQENSESHETIAQIPTQNEESIELIQQEIHGTPVESEILNETSEESESIAQLEENTSDAVEDTTEVPETNETVDGVCEEPEPMEVDQEITPPVVEEHCFKKPLDPKLPPKDKEETKRKAIKVLLPVKEPENKDRSETKPVSDEKLHPDEENANEILNTDENLKSGEEIAEKAVEEKTDEETAVEDTSSDSLPDPTPMDVDEIDAKLAKIKDMVGEESSIENLVESEEATAELTAEATAELTAEATAELTAKTEIENNDNPEATELDEVKATAEISTDSQEPNEPENHMAKEEKESLEIKPDEDAELPKSEEPSQIHEQEPDEHEVIEHTFEETSPLDSTEDSIPDDIEAKLRSLNQTDSEDTQESIEQPAAPPTSTKETLLTDLSSTSQPSSDDSADSGHTNETPKIEVKELVSDWCDEEPQSGPEEVIKPEPIRESDQNMKKNKEEKVKKTPQTKALLKDWDDGDTDGDSQTSDDQPAPDNRINPINNLIDDWADDD